MTPDDREEIKRLRERRRKLKSTKRTLDKQQTKREKFVKRKSRQIDDKRIKENVKGGYGKGTYDLGKKQEEGTGSQKRRNVSKRLYLRSPEEEKKQKAGTVSNKDIEPEIDVTVTEGETQSGEKSKKLGEAKGKATDAGKVAQEAGMKSKKGQQKKGERFAKEAGATDEQGRPIPGWKQKELQKTKKERKLKKQIASLEEQTGTERSDVNQPYMEKIKDIRGRKKGRTKITQKYATKEAAKAAAASFTERFKGEEYKGRGFETDVKGKRLVAKGSGKRRRGKGGKKNFYRQY